MGEMSDPRHPWNRFGGAPYTYDITIDDFRPVTQKDMSDYADLTIAWCHMVEFIESKRGIKTFSPIVKYFDKERDSLKERLLKNTV